MIDIDKGNLERVLDILYRHFREYEIWAFGSRVKGTARKYSDLDLAVITNKKIDLEKMIKAMEDFAESDIPFRVDILDWSTVSNKFKEIILKHYIVVKPEDKEVRCEKKI